MITLANDILPQSFLSYVAFRVAFLDTVERISWTLQFESLNEDRFGYLTEVPFFRSVPPHVQLDLLASTWWKHISSDTYEADLVDEAVVYAVCESSARIAEEESVMLQRFLKKGPLAVDVVADHQLASELRGLHLKLSNEGDFLLIGQFSDLPPEEADRLKQKFEFDSERAEAMFEVLGRWHIASNFPARTEHLLNPDESKRCFQMIQQKVTGRRLKS